MASVDGSVCALAGLAGPAWCCLVGVVWACGSWVGYSSHFPWGLLYVFRLAGLGSKPGRKDTLVSFLPVCSFLWCFRTTWLFPFEGNMHCNQWPDQKAYAGWSHAMFNFLASIAGLSHWFWLWVRQFKLTFDRIQTRRMQLSYAPAYPTALGEFIATFPLANRSITWRNDVWLFWHNRSLMWRRALQKAFYLWRGRCWVRGTAADITPFMIDFAHACHQEPIDPVALGESLRLLDALDEQGGGSTLSLRKGLPSPKAWTPRGCSTSS